MTKHYKNHHYVCSTNVKLTAKHVDINGINIKISNLNGKFKGEDMLQLRIPMNEIF